MQVRARSSAVEHFVDIEVVTGSIPVAPTIPIRGKMRPVAGHHRPLGHKQSRRSRRDKETAMKVKNSLRSLKSRHRDCQVVRRKGRVYVINKTQKRFKARQG